VPGQQPTGEPMEDYLQQFVAGVSGLDGTKVLQAYQAEPPNLPDLDTDWAAMTINNSALPDGGLYIAVVHHPEGEGSDEIQRHEEFEVRVTFYGPNSANYATNFRDGLAIWQNFSALRMGGMALVSVAMLRHVPELIKQTWVNRSDTTFTIRRFTQRFYPVLNLLSAQARVQTDSVSQYKVDVKVDPPTE